jgi:G3E family GTPase
MTTRLVIVGGFLGAGKTTLLLTAARRLTEQGYRVGLLTNDQGADLVETFRKAGGKPLALTGEQARALVKRDVDRWSKITRDLGIKAE